MRNKFYKAILSLFFFAIANLIFSWPISARHYRIIDLGTLGGSNSGAIDINDQGQIVGGSVTCDDEYHAWLSTKKGGMVDLGTLGGADSNGIAINNKKQVVGPSDTGEFVPDGYYQPCGPPPGVGITHAFIWTESEGMVDLGTAGGEYSSSTASDINDLGQIAGQSECSAHFWTPDGQIINIGTLGGKYSRAFALNNQGQVVGCSDVSEGGPGHAFMWTEQNGITDLGVGCARDINSHGQIVGGGAMNAALLWEGANQVIELGDGTAYGINDNGEVVGQGDGAFLWDSINGMQSLNDLIPPCSGWFLLVAQAINNDGKIVGEGQIDIDKDGRYDEHHAFLLKPVPTIEEIIDVFDDSVTAGTIVGRGREPSLADERLGIFEEKLESVRWLLEHDRIPGARKKLNRIKRLCDGDPYPNDLIKGEAVAELSEMILELIKSLKCK